MSALVPETAVALIRMLSGSPGYPFHAEGEARMAEVLMECTVSMDHARKVIDEFDADFPTIEQLRNTTFRLKEQFVPRPPEPKIEKATGPWASDVLNKLQADMDEHEKQDREMWRRIKQHLKVADFAKVEHVQIYQAMVDLGYELNPHQREVLRLASDGRSNA